VRAEGGGAEDDREGLAAHRDRRARHRDLELRAERREERRADDEDGVARARARQRVGQDGAAGDGGGG
jgi:hypothetical protein